MIPKRPTFVEVCWFWMFIVRIINGLDGNICSKAETSLGHMDSGDTTYSTRTPGSGSLQHFSEYMPNWANNNDVVCFCLLN